jgi:hypothetical protein
MNPCVQKDSFMTTFILQGSKGGAGRTASSVILAAGLATIGLRPIHVQLTLSGIPPVIARAAGVPFATTWLPENDATPEAIQRAIAAKPKCDTVVIDMTRRPVWEIALKPRSVTLFPMRRTPAEIEVALQDYEDLMIHQDSVHSNEDVPNVQRHTNRILPITWPEDLSRSDLVAKVAHIEDPTQRGLAAPLILLPGIPEFSREELDDLINGSNFLCSKMIAEAAVSVAQAAAELVN